MQHIFGWLGFIGITFASLLYFWNLFNPHQKTKRVNLHCTISKLTIPAITAHLISQPITGFDAEWIIWSGLGLYLIIIASGIVLMYLPKAGTLRYHSRTFHPALLVGLAAALLHHVLTKLEIL